MFITLRHQLPSMFLRVVRLASVVVAAPLTIFLTPDVMELMILFFFVLVLLGSPSICDCSFHDHRYEDLPSKLNYMKKVRLCTC